MDLAKMITAKTANSQDIAIMVHNIVAVTEDATWESTKDTQGICKVYMVNGGIHRLKETYTDVIRKIWMVQKDA